MIIREFRQEEAETLFRLFRDTVRQVNIRDYSPAQIAAWTGGEFTPEGWLERTASYRIFVAEDKQDTGNIAGFAELDIDGHIDCFYVSHRHQGQGTGKLLMQKLEDEAVGQKLRRLYAEVSITARPFFEKLGFQVLAEQQVELRGEKLINFRMEKIL
ncbi:GNAT family N-acetyltransferase [Kiloniella laminariae]|uniref:GNAT family N-acetyltransferase n=1 Tax=Kiloniella laminariae TaxID=454162 RepID=A0ABT4LP04_9PROT|nr:GNAT family N-acetyltransferase [Kiloniella laminariae]MCZ4282844.1 GNAT family N-acetyltransferase [Kiloniella laminariae]